MLSTVSRMPSGTANEQFQRLWQLQYLACHVFTIKYFYLLPPSSPSSSHYPCLSSSGFVSLWKLLSFSHFSKLKFVSSSHGKWNEKVIAGIRQKLRQISKKMTQFSTYFCFGYVRGCVYVNSMYVCMCLIHMVKLNAYLLLLFYADFNFNLSFIFNSFLNLLLTFHAEPLFRVHLPLLNY